MGAENPTLLVVVASTRPGRVGIHVGEWFRECARAHGGFDVQFADLAELALPFMDEPHHPKQRKYTHQHTKDWSAVVDGADAFVFVTPEYNHGYNAVLKNALDFLHGEWADKPVGLVSYGGVAAGTRATQQLKPVLDALRMAVTVEAVNVPFVARLLGPDGFLPDDVVEASAGAMLDELARLEGLLRPARREADLVAARS
ncbi:NAD(P)H-dependent oxidoreductase [Georgenia yuyongxinii]|uniref:NAD(P)H-dependent oxidoreductase n=1 Tax=Georgenia yuyongxinii TaxID=2589797 RepID=A0A5B8C0D6_9MICO|nr:NAD(P)H-dependent oxidoreductase [Georgenia yuyongxinii]QDC23480.1 NAD(P)H-dependent oxidoreductase [Georgenia yuyongxinii]